MHSFDLVKQLRSQHDVEILQDSVGDVLTRLALAACRVRLGLLVQFIPLDDLLDCDLCWQLGQFVLRVYRVPVVDEIGLQVFRDYNVYLCFVDLVVTLDGYGSVETLALLLYDVFVDGFA